MSLRWKGKQRADLMSFRRRDDDDSQDMGDGEGDGILLPLHSIGTEGLDASYSVEIQVGSSSQSISLQVDTGSSDLWIASTSCSSSSCSNVPSDKRYDPQSSSSSHQLGASFGLNYLRGSVNGSIVFDTVSIGGYSVEGQALASVDIVDSESLSSSFSGILGLALPDNSVISNVIPATEDSFDGATIASNIFSLAPVPQAPAARFLSLTLSRPGSDTVPALLGIGRHPSNVPQIDGSKIHYTSPLPSLTNIGTSAGQRFWKSNIRDITVWVNNEPKTVTLPTSTGGVGGLPSAILDTGVPVILASKAIADGIYGAIGVGPASDGNYYVDCSTPLNMTITLDDRTAIPLHPLDLTLVPPSDISSKTCTGLIQAADTSAYGDMILGVPFLRSVYMVMAYQVPNSDGSFPDLRPTEESDSASGSATVNEIRPRLGLQSLVNQSVALDEFHRVRVLGQPLGNSPTSDTSSSGNSGHLSVGVEILLGLIGFFALCFGLFALRFFLMRRKYNRGDIGLDKQERSMDPGASASTATGLLGFWRRRRSDHSTNEKSRGEYELTGTGLHGQLSSEDALRKMRYQAYMSKERLASQYSTSTTRTRIADEEDVCINEDGTRRKRTSVGSHAAGSVDDNGHNNEVVHNTYDDPWDPNTALDWGDNRATIVGTGRGDHRKKVSDGSNGRSLSPPGERVPMLQDRQLSPTAPTFAHTRERSVDLPPLPHGEAHGDPSLPASSDPATDDLDLEEFGAISNSMAGIGTAARGSMIDPDMRFSHSHHHSGSMSSTTSTLNARPRPTRMPSGPRQSSMYSTSSLSNTRPLAPP
ncbi:acid protease [Dendrothele bispora CBS 962.96]|uniref:Acid protease n=1 Tax=Dendrothele bispora (strain CBS 962.96) TaxID=1314807 RepID=A0A4S8MIC8_DENBC|nr:acid protease [Dendrothele bispora CBS 962.96]